MSKLKPCGYYVIVDVTPVESVTKGGIILPEDTVEKEQAVEETGTVVSIGPLAFLGMRGCTEEDVERTGLPAHKIWGIDVGDKVEFKKYEGKKSFVKGLEKQRYIPDTHIMGVIDDE